MKQLKLAVIALFTVLTFSNVSAQDSNNPWAVSFGANIVDVRLSSKFGDIAKDYVGTSDWNILPSITRVTIEKYLNDGFTLQLDGSFNIVDVVNSKDEKLDLTHIAMGANVKYDLNMLFGDTTQWFDPYVLMGGSYVTLTDSDSEGMLNIGWGFNTWINEGFGVNFQSVARRNFASKVPDHFQHSVGVVFRFGGKDTDGDGVYDKEDECIDVPGLKEFNGCPDSDGDGIKDSDDACPNVAGLAALNGCPDTDGDGIADKDDMCPNDKGTVANNGCPDTDGDGVVNKDDKCPTVAGPAANAGCPWPDTDGDGVLDKDDSCKNEVGPASNNGCPEPVISSVAEKKIGEFAKTILFNSGKTTFKAGVSDKLDGIVKIMNEFPEANFVIEGHTDNTGSSALNLRISEKRAIAVRDYLVKQGIATTRLDAKGYGEGAPIDTNDTRAGRANNRRVEIKVTNKK